MIFLKLKAYSFYLAKTLQAIVFWLKLKPEHTVSITKDTATKVCNDSVKFCYIIMHDDASCKEIGAFVCVCACVRVCVWCKQRCFSSQFCAPESKCNVKCKWHAFIGGWFSTFLCAHWEMRWEAEKEMDCLTRSRLENSMKSEAVFVIALKPFDLIRITQRQNSWPDLLLAHLHHWFWRACSGRCQFRSKPASNRIRTHKPKREKQPVSSEEQTQQVGSYFSAQC